MIREHYVYVLKLHDERYKNTYEEGTIIYDPSFKLHAEFGEVTQICRCSIGKTTPVADLLGLGFVEYSSKEEREDTLEETLRIKEEDAKKIIAEYESMST